MHNITYLPVSTQKDSMSETLSELVYLTFRCDIHTYIICSKNSEATTILSAVIQVDNRQHMNLQIYNHQKHPYSLLRFSLFNRGKIYEDQRNERKSSLKKQVK